MPRSHARIQVTIWTDQDFVALEQGPQRLYLFLLSQANVTHLGVVPLTVQRWSRNASGYSVKAVRDHLTALEAAGFLVVDYDSEEVLIRSLFRRDGIYKQPNVLRAAVASATSVISCSLRRTLADEIARIDAEDVAEDKRAAAQELLGELFSLLSAGAGGPADTTAEPLPEGVAEPLPEPLPEGVAEGVPEPHGKGFPNPPTRAGAYPLPRTPSATPAPDATSQRRGEPVGFAEWYDAYPVHKGRKAAAAAYARALRSVPANQLLDAARRLAADPTLDPAYAPHPATWLNQGRWDDEGPARPQAVNSAQQREQQHLALVARFTQQHTKPELGA